MRHFALPPGLSDAAVRQRLGSIARIRSHPAETADHAWLDTYDGRMDRGGLILEHEHTAGRTVLRVRRRSDGRDLRALGISSGLPLHPDRLPAGPLRSELRALAGPRVLLPLLRSQDRRQRLEVLDASDKVVARVLLVRRRFLDPGGQPIRRTLRRVCLEPLHGYESWSRRVRRLLCEELGLEQLDCEPLDEGLALAGIVPPFRAQPVAPVIEPAERSDIACRRIIGHLAEVMRHNERGAGDATDPEFLHDFRVAVRRTRTLLVQMRGCLPEATATRLALEFRWLAQETGPARDLDVLGLCLADHAREAGLEPASVEPLDRLLAGRRERAYARVRTTLAGRRYRRLLSATGRFVAAPAPRRPSRPDARRPVAETAGARIVRLYRRARRDGRRIDADSPASALHELRKDCKKLRYLIDLIGLHTAPNPSRTLLRRLRRLQDILGDHQDLEVHGDLFEDLARGNDAELAAESWPHAHTLALSLYARQAAARERFAATFARFARRRTREQVLDAFQPDRSRT